MKATWITPAYSLWTEIVGNPPARPARLAQALAPLRIDGALPTLVLASLRRYLEHQRKSGFVYINLPKWADTWSAWAPKPPPRYVPPAKIPQPPSDADSMTAEEMCQQIEALRKAHPNSPYVSTLERLYGRILAAR